MEAPIAETRAYQHTRNCPDCRRSLPCDYATAHFYGGGLFEVLDRGTLPADRIASRTPTPTPEGPA